MPSPLTADTRTSDGPTVGRLDGVTISDFVYTVITGARGSRASLATSRSAGAGYSESGCRYATISESSIARSAAARMASCSWYSGSSRPGESVKMYCVSSLVSRPTTGSRVDCGLGETIARCSPTSAFSSVDFPTLGRPARTIVPQRVIRGRYRARGVAEGGGGHKFGAHVRQEDSRRRRRQGHARDAGRPAAWRRISGVDGDGRDAGIHGGATQRARRRAARHSDAGWHGDGHAQATAQLEQDAGDSGHRDERAEGRGTGQARRGVGRAGVLREAGGFRAPAGDARASAHGARCGRGGAGLRRRKPAPMYWSGLRVRRWRRSTLPPPREGSTIDADRLNDRVRDGNGCGPVALVASTERLTSACVWWCENHSECWTAERSSLTGN